METVKTFKEFITETIVVIDDVEFDLGSHFLQRLPLRSKIKSVVELAKALAVLEEEIDADGLVVLLKKIRAKLKDIPETGEFLFYSKSLRQGVVASWDAFKNKLKMITFLPAGRHFATSGTTEVALEEKRRYVVINID